MHRKWRDALGIVYFQAFTNTYAPLDILKKRFEPALNVPGVVGLSVATRADCLPDDVCGYLAELAERTFLTVELGLQTADDRTAERINRGHSFTDFVSGYEKLRKASDKISVGVHLINGLPGEDEDTMLETAKKVGSAAPGSGEAAPASRDIRHKAGGDVLTREVRVSDAGRVYGDRRASARAPSAGDGDRQSDRRRPWAAS